MLTVTIAQAQAASPDGYRITIGDELELDILDDTDPPARFVVGSNGQLQLPYIGGIRVEGVTLGEARQLIADAYVQREIFIAPTVELSIASFRPIFVLGDVRTPGKYDYQPFLTAEQAAGLAGGTVISANNEEARVLERRSLEGTLAGLDAELGRLAAQYARVQAQLKDETEASWSDVPDAVKDIIAREVFDALKPSEDDIIALDRSNRETARALTEDAATEAESRIALIDQRESVLKDSLTNRQDELKRVQDLMERGLTTQATVSEAERAVAAQENEILILQEQRSSAMVQLNDLRSQLLQSDTAWEKALITEAQEYRSNIEKLMSQRVSIEDRLLLLQQWMSAGSGALADLGVSYTVRRRTETGVTDLEIEGSDELVPGDQLLIAIIPPEGGDKAEAGQ
ncbi:MAG: polysaccharide biosynthesis/export family protein [Paracoccaceae bacterium]